MVAKIEGGKSDDGKPDLVADGFATVPEVAEYLGVSRGKVYQLMEKRELIYAKFGKSRRVPWRALREYATQQLVGA